jgi:hypothetical protein
LDTLLSPLAKPSPAHDDDDDDDDYHHTMETIRTYASNLVNNLHGSFARLKPEGWIRLVWIVGAYLLLRPYLVKLGARQQQKQHQDEGTAAAHVHPNELRTGKKMAADDTQTRPAESGKKARLR